jgi:hypothetical protein
LGQLPIGSFFEPVTKSQESLFKVCHAVTFFNDLTKCSFLKCDWNEIEPVKWDWKTIFNLKVKRKKYANLEFEEFRLFLINDVSTSGHNICLFFEHFKNVLGLIKGLGCFNAK